MVASPGVFNTPRGRINHDRAGQDPVFVKQIPSAIPLPAGIVWLALFHPAA
jgi:hypothetical protein